MCNYVAYNRFYKRRFFYIYNITELTCTDKQCLNVSLNVD